MSLSFVYNDEELRVSQFVYVIYARGGGKNIFFVQDSVGNFVKTPLGSILRLRARFDPQEKPELNLWRIGTRQKVWQKQRLLSFSKVGKPVLHPALEPENLVIDKTSGEIVLTMHQILFTAKNVWEGKYEIDLQFKFEMKYAGLVVETPAFPVPQYRPEDSIQLDQKRKRKTSSSCALASPPEIDDPRQPWEELFSQLSIEEDFKLDPEFTSFVEETDVLFEIEQQNDPLRVLLNDYVLTDGHSLYDSGAFVDTLQSMCMVRDNSTFENHHSSAESEGPKLQIIAPVKTILGTTEFSNIGCVPTNPTPLSTCLVSDDVMGAIYLNLQKMPAGTLSLYSWDVASGHPNVVFQKVLTDPCSLLIVHEFAASFSLSSILVELSTVDGTTEKKVFRLKALESWTPAELVEWLFLFAIENNLLDFVKDDLVSFAHQIMTNPDVAPLLLSNQTDHVAPLFSGAPFVFHQIVSALLA